MYNILLVDDELPALRFMETLISKYESDFHVVDRCLDGLTALNFLQNNPGLIDLIITDIYMPDMDGITLAKAARKSSSDIHIIIVSGYQDFEYAHGAIEASVDDYILKPVSVSHMRNTLEKIKVSLDMTRRSSLSKELALMLKDQPYDEAFIEKAFGDDKYYFALLRYGNVIYPQGIISDITITIQNLNEGASIQENGNTGSADIQADENDRLYILSGRDDKELIFIAKASRPISTFQNAIRRIAGSSDTPTVTIVFAPLGRHFRYISQFYEQASYQLRYSTVIGQYKEVLISENQNEDMEKTARKARSASIPSTIIKRLRICVENNDRKGLKEIFDYLGNSWDENQVTQRQAYVMMQQVIHLVQTMRLNHLKPTEQIILESDKLTNTVSSYSELMDRLYAILFDRVTADPGQLSPEEMYEFAIKAIEERFALPISIQTVCQEIGISQTYLSRLFRRFGNTSFNAYLIRCRMDNAKRLLAASPDMPLNQIASCVGYEDYAYFSKVFRQYTGYSPSQYLTMEKDQMHIPEE